MTTALAIMRAATMSIAVLAIAAAAPSSAAAQPAQNALAAEFSNWIAEAVWPEAERAGVSRATFNAAFDDVTLNLDLPDLVLPGAGGGPPIDQAEFRSPGAYFDESGLAALTRLGREELQRWSATLSDIESRYGVPAAIVLAIWARESAFGRASIPHYAIEALATRAFLGRRADKFRGELIAALQILETGDVSMAAMRSSWAGGLGLPQFLPSTFLAYAVDQDGDGRRNIWTSVPDALASIANYLALHGWDSSLAWGEEVSLPANVSCTLEGPHQGRAIADWRQLGIDGGGRPRETRYLLLPAGRLGPAFLVTDNFYVLKAYNESDVYALYVGHLADRIAGRTTAFIAGWQPIGALTHGEIQAMQLRLEAAGYDVGGADGLIGFRTRIAVGTVQAALGLPQTCFPDRALIQLPG